MAAVANAMMMSHEFAKRMDRWAALRQRAREHGWYEWPQEDGGSQWYVRDGQPYGRVVQIPHHDYDGDLLEQALDADDEDYRAWRAQKWEAA